ncbi:peptidylprolyl isomerase [Rhizobium sp. RU20A]|uniref:peptidylprolyl isomerase n=1 Tax=Rhizobium sp. RU20A TaxID=1907412 RepID=UPI00122CBF5B|nr:peptidylprolyl isomerase [Rhizobium sp. RU20A]
MLELLRAFARTWIMKGLMIVLVISFAVWGISSSLHTGVADSVVTVGDVKVKPLDFRLAYERQLAQLSRQFGQRLTPDQARAFGVEAQVFSQVIAGATLDQLAEDMSLGLSKDRLAQLISEDPTFHGVNGQFDRVAFTSILRNAGLREQDYIANRSQVAVRSQIVDAVSDGYQPPKVLVDAIKQYRQESRTVDFLMLSNANIDPVKAPTDDVLAPWFETNKANYKAPEFRKVGFLKLEPVDIADESSVSDEDLTTEYERRKATFSTPETRTIEQLTFPSRQAADEAAAKLAAGTSFDQLVTEQGKTATDVLLGDFTKDALPDQKIAEAAFAVATDGGTTPVVDGAFAPVIVRVSNIKPATVQSFDEVKDTLRKDIALDNASNEIVGIHDRIEEMRLQGTPIKEAAEQMKLTYVEVPAIDARGNDKDGDPVTNLPQAPELLSEIFNSDVNGETQPVTLGRDGYVWFDVLEIEPARDRTLAEARERVVADWTAEQQRAALAARAKQLEERVLKGETLQTIATELGLAVETKSGLRRNAQDAALSPAAVAAAFGGANGHVATAPGVGGEGQILLKVTDVQDAPADVLDNDARGIEAVARASGDDILDQMVSTLQSAYGVQINQALAEQTIASTR